MTDEHTPEIPQNDATPVAAPTTHAPTAPEPQRAPDPQRTKAQAAFWAKQPAEDFQQFIEAYEQMGGTVIQEMRQDIKQLRLDTARKDALLEHNLDKKYGKYIKGDSPEEIYQQAQELAADLAELQKNTGGDKPKPETKPSSNPPVAEKGAGAGGVSPPPPPPPTPHGSSDPVEARRLALIQEMSNR